MKWLPLGMPWPSQKKEEALSGETEEERQAREACKMLLFPSQQHTNSDVSHCSSVALPLLTDSDSRLKSETSNEGKRRMQLYGKTLCSTNMVDNNGSGEPSKNHTSSLPPRSSSLSSSSSLLPSSSAIPKREILRIERETPYAAVLSWKELPSCPIAGYYVTEEGVWEEGEEKDNRAATRLPSSSAWSHKQHLNGGGIEDEKVTPQRGSTNTPPPGSTRSMLTPFSMSSSTSPPADSPGTSARLLTSVALRERILQLQCIEQQAKMEVDDQLPDQVRSRSLRGLEIIVNSVLFFVGIYYMTWKTARLYQGGIPRQSLFFTKALGLFRRFHVSAQKREQLAQRHRRLMQATNARVTFSFCTGLGLTMFAWWTRPTSTVLEDAPEMKKGKQVVTYQKISSATLKWMWYVYFHHPAYALSASRNPPRIS